jgi:hypothetical protein
MEINMSKVLLLMAALALASAAVPSYAQQATTRDQLIGSWKVLSLKATTGDKVAYPLGEQVAGYVTITPTRLWLLFVAGTRKAPAAPTLTDAEAVTMMKTQVAWNRVYFVQVHDNKMTFTGRVIVPMTGATSMVEFELVKAD